MSPYSVGAVAATEGVVQVSVVRLVALVGCGGSVALGWLGCVWLVETYFGGCCEMFVGKRDNVVDGGV